MKLNEVGQGTVEYPFFILMLLGILTIITSSPWFQNLLPTLCEILAIFNVFPEECAGIIF
jgi:hypothetical protein